MNYSVIERRLKDGGIVILDGGTGTELERRGVTMDPNAWCGPASLQNASLLESIHLDYITAGADIITANTYASSRLMLEPAGFGEQFKEINRTAIGAALRVREACGRDDVLVAGSLSHMCPVVPGTSTQDKSQAPSKDQMAEAFAELANLHLEEGCDLILLEMMYYPDRFDAIFPAALETGLPVWAGFSARYGKEGDLISFAEETEIPFTDLVPVMKKYDVAAAGIMHTPSNVIGEALDVLRSVYTGPLTAYPDSGFFKMPSWQFEDVIPPDELLKFANEWVENGVQVIGGCCGLSPEHIQALKPLKEN